MRAKVVKLRVLDVFPVLPVLPVLRLPGPLHRAFFPVNLIGGSGNRRGISAFLCSAPRQARCRNSSLTKSRFTEPLFAATAAALTRALHSLSGSRESGNLSEHLISNSWPHFLRDELHVPCCALGRERPSESEFFCSFESWTICFSFLFILRSVNNPCHMKTSLFQLTFWPHGCGIRTCSIPSVSVRLMVGQLRQPHQCRCQLNNKTESKIKHFFWTVTFVMFTGDLVVSASVALLLWPCICAAGSH